MIIVFGGSFNPPTIAHEQMIKKLYDRFQPQKVILLPVSDRYPKTDLISFQYRFDMLSILAKKYDYVIVSDLEKEKGYQGTYHSLNQLKDMYQTTPYFVIGSDHLQTLDRWIDYKSLLKDYPLIVMHRKGFLSKEQAEKKYQNLQHTFIYVDFYMDVSASKIRSDFQSYQDDLDQDILAYIQKHQLYQGDH